MPGVFVQEGWDTYIIGNSKYKFKIDVLKDSGEFLIHFDGKTWLSSGYLLHKAGKWYSNMEKSHNPYVNATYIADNFEVEQSEDRNGEFTSLHFILKDRDSRQSIVAYEIRVYHNLPVVLFSIVHLTEVEKPQALYEHTIIDAPLYLKIKQNKDMKAFTYTSHAWIKPIFLDLQKALSETIMASSFFSIFDRTGRTLIFSAFDNLGNQLYTITQKDNDFYVICGLEGLIEKIPVGSRITEVLIFGSEFEQAIENWGTFLRTHYNKILDENLDLINKLSYWTDCGSYYYYRTIPEKDYSDTLIALSEDLKRKGINVRLVELGPWWYSKDPSAGAKAYEPVPEIKLNLNELAQEIGFLILQMSWFNLENEYTKRFSFIKEKIAFPRDYEIYDYLGGRFREYGATAVVHDHLTQIRSSMRHHLMDNFSILSNWLKSMAEHFRRYMIRIILSMPDTYHLFSSLQTNNIVASRTGEDYGTSASQSYSLWQNIYTSQLALALGLFPHFGVFFTSHPTYNGEPTNENGNLGRINPEVDALARVLTFSIVGFGDAICTTNVDLIKNIAHPDCTVIRPDKPAMPIFRNFLNDPRKTKTALILKTTAKAKYIILGVFNVTDDAEVNYSISLNDLGIIGTYYALEWFSRNTIIIRNSNSDALKGKLKPSHAHLWILSPIMNENTPIIIGDISYFIAPNAIQFRESYNPQERTYTLTLEPKRESTIAIYSPSAPKKILLYEKPIEFKYEYISKKKLLLINTPHQYLQLKIHF